MHRSYTFPRVKSFTLPYEVQHCTCKGVWTTQSSRYHQVAGNPKGPNFSPPPPTLPLLLNNLLCITYFSRLYEGYLSSPSQFIASLVLFPILRLCNPSDISSHPQDSNVSLSHHTGGVSHLALASWRPQNISSSWFPLSLPYARERSRRSRWRALRAARFSWSMPAEPSKLSVPDAPTTAHHW